MELAETVATPANALTSSFVCLSPTKFNTKVVNWEAKLHLQAYKCTFKNHTCKIFICGIATNIISGGKWTLCLASVFLSRSNHDTCAIQKKNYIGRNLQLPYFGPQPWSSKMGCVHKFFRTKSVSTLKWIKTMFLRFPNQFVLTYIIKQRSLQNCGSYIYVCT